MKLPILLSCTLIVQLAKSDIHTGGILFPRESETREVISLDGLWNFVIASNTSESSDWYQKSLKLLGNQDVQLMPVPASYNDVTTDWSIRDHVGLVWYDRKFFVPKQWAEMDGKIWIRFGSVTYAAQVWINGELAMSHEIGHLPFAAEIKDLLKFGEENLISVACDNTLMSDTIPQGGVQTLSSGRLELTYTFDFFHYAGIDRPVKLYTTPSTYVDDIAVETELKDGTALLHYNLTILGDATVFCKVSLIDKNNEVVAKTSDDTTERTGILTVEKPNLWWPYLMKSDPGYLYKFQVELLDSKGALIDKYSLPVGLRTITWTNTALLINDAPLYLNGFGRHEDSDIRGKGLDLPLIIHDYNLIKWIGANAYRTSHYPYAEEIMDLADEIGIMIIDECPAVNIEKFSDSLLENHKKSLTELIKRDKNRPSVIIWSAANEPRTHFPEAEDYFGSVISHIKTLDLTRPTTIVEYESSTVNSSKFVDIISINKYYGWYQDPGNLDTVTKSVIGEATAWFKRFNKPVIMQEYGADTMEGLHFLPTYIWSEEYQVNLMSKYFEAFDQMRESGFFIGEFIWNFADFKTAQSFQRVGGNKKGIFSRNRQPKSSAHHLRRRYWALAHEFYNVTMPSDLTDYVISAEKTNRDEL